MFDFGCHRLEVLLNLFGPVERVTGLVSNAVLDRDVEDTAVAVLQTVGGTCATVTVTHAACEPRDTLRIFGSHGSIHVDNLNSGRMRVTIGATEREERHAPAANLHAPLVQDFVDAVLTRRDPAVGGDIGRAVAEIEEQIYARADLRS
jgi:predicted dehydrogenase